MDYLLHHLLSSSAAHHPDRTAVVDGYASLTYAQLEGRSSRLANLLIQTGVARGDRVALYLGKSIEAVVAIYAILKCGAAYVPIDAQAPLTRTAFIMSNCGVTTLVTEAEKIASVRPLCAAGAPLDRFVVVNSEQPAEFMDGSPRAYTAANVAAQPDRSPKWQQSTTISPTSSTPRDRLGTPRASCCHTATD